MLGFFLLMAIVGGLTARSCTSQQQKQQALKLKKMASEIAPEGRL